MAKKVHLITKLFSYPQMSTISSSTAPTAAALAMKHVWNSPPDAEMVLRYCFRGIDDEICHEKLCG